MFKKKTIFTTCIVFIKLSEAPSWRKIKKTLRTVSLSVIMKCKIASETLWSIHSEVLSASSLLIKGQKIFQGIKVYTYGMFPRHIYIAYILYGDLQTASSIYTTDLQGSSILVILLYSQISMASNRIPSDHIFSVAFKSVCVDILTFFFFTR